MSAKVHTLETPCMLDDKYRVDSLMAVGGMGAVYRGSHTKLQKTVAIKLLKRELVGATDLVERFQREAVAASQIGHEGIIEVTDIGTSRDGDPFLVMEYLQGRDLATCLKDLGPLKPATAARVCCEILSALAAAHDKNIIHRDLKPENVFVCQRSRGESLKILDFGISRMLVDGETSLRLTTTGMVMGTPYYMSPEQALGETRAEKTADLYSVGVILYELITGAVPYKATNYNALLHQILSGEYELPSRLANVSPEFEAIIVKAMSMRAEDRYGSARQLAGELAPFCEPIATPLLSPHTPPPDTCDDARPVSGRAEHVSGVENTIAATPVVQQKPEADTLGPVVTPVPMDLPPRRSMKAFVAMGALACLALVGGAMALLADGSVSSDQATTSKAASQGEGAELASAVEPSAAHVVPETTPAELVTLTFAIAPHDAQVFVDGQLIEGNQIEAAPGRFVIEVRREGFAPEIRSVDAASSEKLVFALKALEPVAPELVSDEPDRATTKSTAGKRNLKLSRKNKASGESKDPPATGKQSDGRFVEDSPYDAK